MSFLHLRAICSSKNPLWTDERTITEKGMVNYESHLPWELARGCNDTFGDMLESLT
jgi:hypothetical protein